MRFFNINIEGPDCSGKTTLYQRLHKETKFKYNLNDRSYISMYVYSKIYNRSDSSFWYDKIIDSIKNLNTLYIVLLPEEKTILDRLRIRGDEFQDENSILKVINEFKNCLSAGLKYFPNVLLIENSDIDYILSRSLSFIDELNSIPTNELVEKLVYKSGLNELTDISISEIIDRNNLNYDVLNYPKEAGYYKKITEELINKIKNELSGINEYNTVQKIDSRRFIYTDDSCISAIHALFRNQKLNVFVLFRSSNVEDTFWADYEFIKITCVNISKCLMLPNDCEIVLNIKIRSSHIIP